MTSPFLIVNADDFGQSAGINEGIIKARTDGLVTSASLMVRWPAATAAAAYARSDPALSLGLHVDLGEWIYEDDEWKPLYVVVDADDAGQVEDELDRQLDAFRRLVGHDPTHLDSHQHAHRSEPLRSLLLAAGERMGIPVRGFDGNIMYSGAFYGQTGKGEPFASGITLDAFVAILEQLPPGTVTELGCHPGIDDGTPLVYRTERERELAVLCSSRAKDAVRKAGVSLTSFVRALRTPDSEGAMP